MDTLPHMGQPPCDSQWNQRARQILPFRNMKTQRRTDGWDRFDLGREAGMRRQIHRSVCHLGARRICSQEVALVPIRRRPNRSKDEPAAAILADISQNAFDTSNAEGTLVGADARLKRIRRQRLVAVLAGRSKFKHEILDVQLLVSPLQPVHVVCH